MSTTDANPLPQAAAAPRAVGVVSAAGRLLDDTVLHGEPLVVHARRAMAAAGVDMLGPATSAGPRTAQVSWAAVQDSRLPVVLHDSRCPLTPASFIAGLVDRATSGDTTVLVGCRPVTDTIKTVSDGIVGGTVDRESLVVVASPVVLPPAVVAALVEWPDLSDLPALVRRLRKDCTVELVEAPSLARRVEDASAVLLLEASEELDRGP